MNNRIPESELIINERGAIYHLNLRPEELADNIITVGDPDRVAQVSRHFDNIEVKHGHREFVAHTGYLGKKRLTVISTGIGTDNIDIVLNELDALVNINFETRTIKSQLKQLNVIRIGTSGSLQKAVPVDSFLVSTHGLGVDNLLNFYQTNPDSTSQAMLKAFSEQTGLKENISSPYINPCSAALLPYFQEGFHQGITVTCPGFYGPQGRVLRLALSTPEFIDSLTHFEFEGHTITNFEMETAGLYGLGKLLNHNMLSLNAMMANRITGEFSLHQQKTMDTLIAKALGIICSLP